MDVRIEAPGLSLSGVATTLGAGGLFVTTRDPLPLRTGLVVRFRLPGDDADLEIQARVAWSKEGTDGSGTPGMGLAFDDPGARAELAARLERWADRRASSSGSAAGPDSTSAKS